MKESKKGETSKVIFRISPQESLGSEVLIYCFQPGETNGDSKPDQSPAEELDKKQQQLDELTEKLENAQRTQKELFLIVFQVRKHT